MADDKVNERVARMEERLIAEQSIRKTRDDQLFKYFSTLHKDMEKQGKNLAEQGRDLKEISTNMQNVSESVGRMGKAFEGMQEDRKEDRTTLDRMDGVVRALKWALPFFITLVSIALALLLANIDLKFGSHDDGEEPAVIQPLKPFGK